MLRLLDIVIVRFIRCKDIKITGLLDVKIIGLLDIVIVGF
jgi:hypothetical protein